MRTKKTFYNSVTGILYYFVTVAIGVINRKALISILGIQYQGINGLFSDVLYVLSVAELGVGVAIIYHLYKPLNENNIPEIKSLMQFYKRCYHIIAVAVFVIGCSLMPFLKYLVDGSSIPMSLLSIYIWYLLDVVCSYLFTYKRSMLIADQNNYLINFCDIAYQLTSKLIQIVLLIITKNFTYFLVTMVICRFGENLLINWICNRRYPFLMEKDIEKLHPDILADIILKVKGAFLHRIGGVAVLGSSTIIISRFLGLVSAGIYSNYTLIISALSNIAAQLITSATAGVGQLLTEKNSDKINSIFEQLILLNAGLLNFITTGLFCVITPIVELVFGSQYTVAQSVVFAMSINFYLQGMRKVYHMYKETSGILYEDRYIPLLEAVINLLCGIILVEKIGLAGVIWGTVLSSTVLFCYTYPVLVCKRILGMKISYYIKQFLTLFFLMIVSIFVTKSIINIIVKGSLFLRIFESCVVCLFIPNIIFWTYARNKTEFRLILDRVINLFLISKNRKGGL